MDPHRSKRVVSVPPVMSHTAPSPTKRARRLATFTGALGLLAACHQEPPPGAEQQPTAATAPISPPTPAMPSEIAPKPAEPAPSAAEAASTAPPTPAPEAYSGPYFVATDGSAGVYADTSGSKKQKIGYLRSGSRVPVSAEPVPGEECSRGWYRIRDGGFVCGNAGTTNTTSPEARFAIRTPDLAAVLPYTYARNAKNGTPLYRSVPTAEQMRTYEPYLAAPKADDDRPAAAKPAEGAPKPDQTALPFSKESLERHRDTAATVDDRLDKSAATVDTHDEGADHRNDHPDPALLPDGGIDESTKPWWQRHDVDKRLNELKLDELEADADAILAKRMVKGFYVAVDREFNWNGRPWYKTTKGLVAPADRFWVTTPSEFHGAVLDGEQLALPVAWTYGWQKGRPKYEIDASGKIKPLVGSVENHALVPLTGKETTIAGKKYLEAKDGSWISLPSFASRRRGCHRRTSRRTKLGWT